MKKLLALFTAFMILAPDVLLAQPVPPSVDQCQKVVQDDLTQIHDTYRSYLFGSRSIGGGKFEVLTGGYTDALRNGIFETQRRLTSELVTPLIESYRTYRCRSLDVCALMADSFLTNGGDADIRLLGCEPVTLPRYPACYLKPDGNSPGTPGQFENLQNLCQSLLESTFAAEESVLRLSVAYDAGYRALLQTAGIMDWMLEGFPTGALKAISDMVNLLGKLHQIPCYIGQCDNPRSDYLKP